MFLLKLRAKSRKKNKKTKSHPLYRKTENAKIK